MNFKAAIFDMDGLLLDTERLCMRVFQQACETLGFPFHQEAYLNIIGRNSTGIQKILLQAYGDDLAPIHNEWKQNYDAITHHQAIDVKEGVIALLEWLKANDIPTVVATSTRRELAEIKLKLAGLDGYFSGLTCGCEVSNGKPDPEIYLLAAQRVGVAPEQCIAFEDSSNGVIAAVSAGMQTYQIPDLVVPNDEIKALGHKIKPSLSIVLEELKAS
ncbi:HAD family hydrolase [Vibrio panuliri]|uniref:Phosphatase n=1 Tax=Vibrio panuliri TaxID=1381081 RepID=A0ABX3FAA7_9VIBR|nr:HAD family phosphatase [Vibrio panuliri]KAB1458210.1 HAD family phosphatase [Vibrio panuliri]OLQ88533.1 phosphatase [Vibrio panuliri]